MSECSNQLNLEEIIKKCLADCKKSHDDSYDYDTYEEKNPYGDTWATTSEEITDESFEECDEDFKDRFNVFDFIEDYLEQSEEFRAYIEEMVQKENY